MALLNEIIAKIAALLVASGCPAGSSTLWALIVIYLLVTGMIAVLLVFLFVRRRPRQPQPIAPPPDMKVDR